MSSRLNGGVESVCVSVSSDGKLHDAYVSFVDNDHDRKFVNFILKPYLENKNAYKVHLNDNDILPGGGRRDNCRYSLN